MTGHAGDTPAITAPVEAAPQPVATAAADEQGTLAGRRLGVSLQAGDLAMFAAP